MAQKFIGMRGIDPALYEDMLAIVNKKYGKRRGKHSNVAREINELIRLYVRAEGRLDALTHKTSEDEFMEEMETAMRKGGHKRVDEVLDKHKYIDNRSRDNYHAFMDRYMERVFADERREEANRKKYKDVAGYQ